MRTKNIKERIKEYFFLHPTKKLRVRQIERAINVPLPSVIKYCKELKDEKILRQEEIAGIRVYSADRSSSHFRIQKQLFNLNRVHSSGLVEYLIKELSNPTVVLFGSYAKGEDVEESDIDLYVETVSKKKIDLEEFEKVLKRKIQLFVRRKIADIPGKELINNIINGHTLSGFLEVAG